MQMFHVMYAGIDRVENITELFAATAVLAFLNAASDDDLFILASVSFLFFIEACSD